MGKADTGIAHGGSSRTAATRLSCNGAHVLECTRNPLRTFISRTFISRNLDLQQMSAPEKTTSRKKKTCGVLAIVVDVLEGGRMETQQGDKGIQMKLDRATERRCQVAQADTQTRERLCHGCTLRASKKHLIDRRCGILGVNLLL